MDGGSCPGVGVLTRKINDFVESCNAQARSFVRVAADPAWPRSIQPSQDPTPLYFLYFLQDPALEGRGYVLEMVEVGSKA